MHSLTTPGLLDNKVNLLLLNEQDQNLTTEQKLLLEYHFHFGHTNIPLVQQILRSELLQVSLRQYVGAKSLSVQFVSLLRGTENEL